MQSRAARVSFFLLGLLPLSFASAASAQGFIRYIYPPNVVSMIETDSALQVTKPFHFPDGTSSAPSGAFASSPATGFYLTPLATTLYSYSYPGVSDSAGLAFSVPLCDWITTGCWGSITSKTHDLTGYSPPTGYPFAGVMLAEQRVIGTQADGTYATMPVIHAETLYSATKGTNTKWTGVAIKGVARTTTNPQLGEAAGVAGWALIDTSSTIQYALGLAGYMDLGADTVISNWAAAIEVVGTSASTDGTDDSKIFKIKADRGYGRSWIDQPRDTDYALELTNGKGLLVTGKTDQLQLAKAAGGAKPTCDATARGSIWYEPGGAGVKDTVEVCAKDAGDVYAWRTIY